MPDPAARAEYVRALATAGLAVRDGAVADALEELTTLPVSGVAPLFLLGDQTVANMAPQALQARYQAGVLRYEQTVREAIQDAVVRGIEEGLPMPEIAARLREAAPSMARTQAQTIAQTETIAVYGDVYRQVGTRLSGMTGGLPLVYEWQAGYDDKVCEQCAALDRTTVEVADASAWPGGLRNPPAHPRCRCRIVARPSKEFVDRATAALRQAVDAGQGQPVVPQPTPEPVKPAPKQPKPVFAEPKPYDATLSPGVWPTEEAVLAAPVLAKLGKAAQVVEVGGNYYVRKVVTSQARAQGVAGEEAAAEIYRRLGVDTPASRLYRASDGTPTVRIARYVPGAQAVKDTMLADDYIADLIAGNRPASGKGTAIMSDGKVYRMTSESRWAKPLFRPSTLEQPNDGFPELFSGTSIARTPPIKGLTVERIAAQARKIDPELLDLSRGGDSLWPLVSDDVRLAVLRRAQLARSIGVSGTALLGDGFTAAYVADFWTAQNQLHMMGLPRKLPGVLYQSGYTTFVDEMGHEFDALRYKDAATIRPGTAAEVVYRYFTPGERLILDRYGKQQGDGSWNLLPTAWKYHVTTVARPGFDRDVWFKYGRDTLNPDAPPDFKPAAQIYRETIKAEPAFLRSMVKLHALTYTMLENVTLPTDIQDQAARTIRVIRSESGGIDNMRKWTGVDLQVGQTAAVWPRGAAESTSVVVDVSLTSNPMWTSYDVPYHRIWATYLLRGIDPTAWGNMTRDAFFLSDGENEFVANLVGLPARIVDRPILPANARTQPTARIRRW